MKGPPMGTIYALLKKEVSHYHVPVVDLMEMQTHDPFKVLVTTMLSARTKDETTLVAAKKLFAQVHKPADLEFFSLKQIEKLIYPVGFYRTKAKHLKKLPETLNAFFNSRIPEALDDLMKIDGVGRKTANLVVAVAFKKPGMCVDTHVHRIMNRLGYVKTKTPHETEMALRKKLPLQHWEHINSMLVAFGQNTCRPISPWCSRCVIKKYCNQVGVSACR